MNKNTIRAALRIVGRLLFAPAAAAIVGVLTEWIARGSLDAEFWDVYFALHTESYVLAWAFLLACWLAVDALTHFAPLATLVMGGLGCIPATVNYYTMTLRGEPFVPWDLSQMSEAGGVAAAAGIVVQKSMIVSGLAVLALAVLSFFLYRGRARRHWYGWLAQTAAGAGAVAVLVLCVFLQPTVTTQLGIQPDPWMQDRYYRWYGMISAFMTNLQNLEISKPDGYTRDAVDALLDETAAAANRPVYYRAAYENSYAALERHPEKAPTIIYVMNESYWDVSELDGVTFDTDVSANLHALQQVSASGRIYSPSFGGGTCDVEFEALTGYSVAHLPTGCKPYQQHVTHTMFSLPNYLKTKGYQTAALHCYYAKYWSRDTAYPFLGFDDFISLEDMRGVTRVRNYYWKNGLVTDASMTEQLIAEYERLKAESDAPVFLHTVTMQNHTNYNAANYSDDERVHILEAPAALTSSTVGALEDFATGVRDADQMLGALTAYFSQVDEPVILVFWGDHYNPIDSGYDVYTATGYASDSSADPALHTTNLLIWSNYCDSAVDLGTVAAYEITPVMMELYGLRKPLYFEYLFRQLTQGYRSRSAGVTVNPDGTTDEALSEEQLAWYKNQWLLQYDLMFGKAYALDRMGLVLADADETA